MAMIEFGHGTHAGLRRKCNEDTYHADPSTGLFLVVDGMGGLGHGDVAAAMARDAVVQALDRGLPLDEAIGIAARDLTHARQQAPTQHPMGATLAVLHLGPTSFEAAWVGDCRIHVQNHDLTLLQPQPDAVEDDTSAPDDAPAPAAPIHRHDQAATQALGITPMGQLTIHRAHGQTNSRAGFLLCSDGLTEDVPAQGLASVMARRDIAAQEAVDHLLLMALDAGGHDNMTAIVVRKL